MSFPPFVEKILLVFIGLSLLLTFLVGMRVLLDPVRPPLEDRARYQAYYLAGPDATRFFSSARRLDATLILVATEFWMTLEPDQRTSHLEHLSRYLVGADLIESLVVVDRRGHPLGSADRRGVSVLAVDAGFQNGWRSQLSHEIPAVKR